MSWSIKAIGTRAAIKAKVLADANIPDGIKAAVTEICDEVGTEPSHLSIEGYGHRKGNSTGSYGGSISKFDLTPVAVLADPQPINSVSTTASGA